MDTTQLLLLSDFPGFDPEGLRVYRAEDSLLRGVVVHSSDEHNVPFLCFVGHEDDRISGTTFEELCVSLSDHRTEDALWRWARERMGWPRWARWSCVVLKKYGRRFTVLGVFPGWEARSGPYANAQLPALADATSDLHALATVLRWIGQQPEVKR